MWPSVSERSSPRTGKPTSRRESPPYTPQARRKQQPSAMYETNVGTVAGKQQAVWDQHSAKRNCAGQSYLGNSYASPFLRLALPVRRRCSQTQRCHSLGGRPFAQPVGALPFLGWSPASSLGVGRPGMPPLRAGQRFAFNLTFLSGISVAPEHLPAPQSAGVPFPALPRAHHATYVAKCGFVRTRRAVQSFSKPTEIFKAVVSMCVVACCSR